MSLGQRGSILGEKYTELVSTPGYARIQRIRVQRANVDEHLLLLFKREAYNYGLIGRVQTRRVRGHLHPRKNVSRRKGKIIIELYLLPGAGVLTLITLRSNSCSLILYDDRLFRCSSPRRDACHAGA